MVGRASRNGFVLGDGSEVLDDSQRFNARGANRLFDPRGSLGLSGADIPHKDDAVERAGEAPGKEIFDDGAILQRPEIDENQLGAGGELADRVSENLAVAQRHARTAERLPNRQQDGAVLGRLDGHFGQGASPGQDVVPAGLRQQSEAPGQLRLAEIAIDQSDVRLAAGQPRRDSR